MLGTSDNRSLALQVEVDEAAVSPEVESGRHARFQWTGLGFAGLMLIGLSAYVLLPAAPHAPEGPWPLDAAFSPTLPMASPANLKQAVQPLSPPVFKQGDIFQLPKRDLAHQPTAVTAQRNGAARVPGRQAPAAPAPAPAMRVPREPRQPVPAFPRDPNAVEEPSLFAALGNLIPKFNPLAEQQLYRPGDFLKNDEQLNAEIARQMQTQNLKDRPQDNRPGFSQPELPGLMPGFFSSGALDTDRSPAQQAADARAAQLTKESTSERIARKRQEAKEKAFGTVGMTTDDIRVARARQGSGGRIGSNRAAMPDYTKDQFGFPIDETGIVETGGARDRLGYVGGLGKTQYEKQPTPSGAGRLGSLFGRGSPSPSTPRAQAMANARAAPPAANARGNLRQQSTAQTVPQPAPVRQAAQPAGGRMGSVGSNGYVEEDGGAVNRLFGFLGRSGSSGKPAAEPQAARQASAGIQTATASRLGSQRQGSQTATVGRLGSQRQASAPAQRVARPPVTPRGTQRVATPAAMPDDFQLNEVSLKAMNGDGEDYVEEGSVFDKLGGVFGRIR